MPSVKDNTTDKDVNPVIYSEMFSNITSVGIVGGIVYGIAKKKSFKGVVVCAILFGIAGAMISAVHDQITK